MTGFLYQVGGIVFEATRLVMVQRLLSSAEFKMDPLVSLYYFAPACAIMNGLTALFIEVPKMTLADVEKVGYLTLIINAMIAFLLNVSVVFLVCALFKQKSDSLLTKIQIGKTSSLVMTLSGVLKDILLVVASMMIFHDPVSGLQAFGYSIALGGLVYYKLGSDKLKVCSPTLFPTKTPPHPKTPPNMHHRNTSAAPNAPGPTTEPATPPSVNSSSSALSSSPSSSSSAESPKAATSQPNTTQAPSRAPHQIALPRAGLARQMGHER